MTAGSLYRGRFAPSPTGPLHLGSLLAAFASWLDARVHGGEWLIRIEDLDPPRERAGAAREHLRVLAACGLHSDREVVWQSQRHALYEQALATLAQRGLSFACSCSRRELEANGGLHLQCTKPATPQRQAIRLRVGPGSIEVKDRLRGSWSESPRFSVGDFVLKRADGFYAYQLAVVVDDAEQGISDVVRGADLLESTARQQLLQQALGLPTPRYLHLPLVLGADGHKLSKSLAALPIDAADPLPALRFVWQALGQEPAAVADAGAVSRFLNRAERHFDPSRLSSQPLATPCPLDHQDTDGQAD